LRDPAVVQRVLDFTLRHSLGGGIQPMPMHKLRDQNLQTYADSLVGALSLGNTNPGQRRQP
jgi:hypothetical protein